MSRFLVFLAVVAMTSAMASGCGRSQEEQEMYDLGYDYADSMIDDLGITDDDAIYDGCGTLAIEKGLTPKGDQANALGDGCWDRIHE